MRFSRLSRPAALLLCLAAPRLMAQDYSVANLNSTLGINALNGGFGPAGLTSWTVEGINQLKFQTFYYRLGSGPELALNSISTTPVVNQSGNHIDITYANSALSLKVTYDLFGNQVGSSQSGLGYSVQIQNLTTAAMDLNLFQYSDFDLGGSGANQSVVLQQIGNRYKQAGQTIGGLSMTNQFSITAIPLPTTTVEAGLFNTGLASMTDGAQTTLSGAAGAGPGDVAYLVGWNTSLAAGASVSLSGSFTLAVPEPSVLSIVALAGLVGLKRFRKN